jgi:RNA polymerase sigma factor (sigma-70 family)
LLNENFTIKLLITGCGKNDRTSQKGLYNLLSEFALKIAYRYTSIDEDPMDYVYKGFLELLTNLPSFNKSSNSELLCALKNLFKNILLDTCIEFAKPENYNQKEFTDYLSNGHQQSIQSLSSEEIIERVRALPFPDRIIFNLAVIDNFDLFEISAKLQIPLHEVASRLRQSRERLQMDISLNVIYEHL